MHALLKEVGRGKRGSRDLSYEEAVLAAELIIGEKASPAQIGAFLMAERMKSESEDELRAFIDVFRKISFKHPLKNSLSCSGPYDGRSKSFMAGFASAFILAACDLPVSLHGSPSLPPKWGITLYDLLKVLNIDLRTISREKLTQTAEKTGILTLPSEEWCPPLRNLRGIREELGMRTILNSVEKLMNLSDSPYMIFGIFHNTVFDPMSRVLSSLGLRKSIIVQGAEGSEDISLERPTRTLLVQQGKTELYIINPEVLGIKAKMPEMNWSPELQIRITMEVLLCQADTPFYHMVLLNSALRLFAADRVDSLEDGIFRAKITLDQGVAFKKFDQWLNELRDCDQKEENLFSKFNT